VNRRHGVKGQADRFGAALARIDRFDDATRLVSDATRELGVASCRVVMRPQDDVATTGEVAFPVIGRQGRFATLVCAGATAAHHRDLALIAMYLSVWCTEHGIGASHDALTRRQMQIAELAALGKTNAEIGAALGITVNTVKARLKQVFERLGVANRTALATELRRRTPPST
jgi:DNA-binding CsgD family transcriptional regulator